jgi:hypothetical protein
MCFAQSTYKYKTVEYVRHIYIFMFANIYMILLELPKEIWMLRNEQALTKATVYTNYSGISDFVINYVTFLRKDC